MQRSAKKLRPPPLPADPAPRGAKRVRLGLFAILALLGMAVLVCGIAAAAAVGRSASSSPIVVQYYNDATANVPNSAIQLAATAQTSAKPATPSPTPAPVAIASANTGRPSAESQPAAPQRPAYIEALKWWSSAPAGEAASKADVAAIIQQTRPIIPASSSQTKIGATPVAIPKTELTDVPEAEARVQCDVQTGKLVTDTLVSPLLSRPLPVHVWLPPCYGQSAAKYPAVYLLQGSGYMLGQWLAHGAPQAAETLIASGLVRPFIIVMPGNDMWIPGQGKYMWSQAGDNSWEEVIADELVPMIERKYAAQPDRESRAIGGISRGGYWSLEIGFSRPEVFATVGSHSPAISRDILIDEPADFTMLKYVKSFDALKQQRLWLDAGDTDWARAGMQELATQLKSKGVAFARSIGNGGHEDEYWTSRIYDYMSFYTRIWSVSPDRQLFPDAISTGD